MTLQVEVERIDIAEPENSGNMAVCVGWGGGGTHIWYSLRPAKSDNFRHNSNCEKCLYFP
jgi:hypothetical protein